MTGLIVFWLASLIIGVAIIALFRLSNSLCYVVLLAMVAGIAFFSMIHGQLPWLVACITFFLGTIAGCETDKRLGEPQDTQLFSPAEWPGEWEN